MFICVSVLCDYVCSSNNNNKKKKKEKRKRQTINFAFMLICDLR